eukprot:CFRG1465T1
MYDEEEAECPLCMEPLDETDKGFFPCVCGYQICGFCWHKLRNEGNGLCPACRKPFEDRPAEFAHVDADSARAKEKQKKSHERKPREQDIRKNLANVRVVQPNLVYVIGLSPRLADEVVIRKNDYFGQYGKIMKVVVNKGSLYNGSQGPSASAYITYARKEDAQEVIRAVDGVMVDNRVVRASFGTTKYCSYFLKHVSCPNPDCMYLHEVGETVDSFTKEEMKGFPLRPDYKRGIKNYDESPSRSPSPVRVTTPIASMNGSSVPKSSSIATKGSKNTSASALPATASWAKKPLASGTPSCTTGSPSPLQRLNEGVESMRFSSPASSEESFSANRTQSALANRKTVPTGPAWANKEASIWCDQSQCQGQSQQQHNMTPSGINRSVNKTPVVKSSTAQMIPDYKQANISTSTHIHASPVNIVNITASSSASKRQPVSASPSDETIPDRWDERDGDSGNQSNTDIHTIVPQTVYAKTASTAPKQADLIHEPTSVSRTKKTNKSNTHPSSLCQTIPLCKLQQKGVQPDVTRTESPPASPSHTHAFIEAKMCEPLSSASKGPPGLSKILSPTKRVIVDGKAKGSYNKNTKSNKNNKPLTPTPTDTIAPTDAAASTPAPTSTPTLKSTNTAAQPSEGDQETADATKILSETMSERLFSSEHGVSAAANYLTTPTVGDSADMSMFLGTSSSESMLPPPGLPPGLVDLVGKTNNANTTNNNSATSAKGASADDCSTSGYAYTSVGTGDDTPNSAGIEYTSNSRFSFGNRPDGDRQKMALFNSLPLDEASTDYGLPPPPGLGSSFREFGSSSVEGESIVDDRSSTQLTSCSANPRSPSAAGVESALLRERTSYALSNTNTNASATVIVKADENTTMKANAIADENSSENAGENENRNGCKNEHVTINDGGRGERKIDVAGGVQAKPIITCNDIMSDEHGDGVVHLQSSSGVMNDVLSAPPGLGGLGGGLGVSEVSSGGESASGPPPLSNNMNVRQWQDNLRSLFPGVNISFSVGNTDPNTTSLRPVHPNGTTDQQLPPELHEPPRLSVVQLQIWGDGFESAPLHSRQEPASPWTINSPYSSSLPRGIPHGSSGGGGGGVRQPPLGFGGSGSTDSQMSMPMSAQFDARGDNRADSSGQLHGNNQNQNQQPPLMGRGFGQGPPQPTSQQRHYFNRPIQPDGISRQQNQPPLPPPSSGSGMNYVPHNNDETGMNVLHDNILSGNGGTNGTDGGGGGYGAVFPQPLHGMAMNQEPRSSLEQNSLLHHQTTGFLQRHDAHQGDIFVAHTEEVMGQPLIHSHAQNSQIHQSQRTQTTNCGGDNQTPDSNSNSLWPSFDNKNNSNLNSAWGESAKHPQQLNSQQRPPPHQPQHVNTHQPSNHSSHQSQPSHATFSGPVHPQLHRQGPPPPHQQRQQQQRNNFYDAPRHNIPSSNPNPQQQQQLMYDAYNHTNSSHMKQQRNMNKHTLPQPPPGMGMWLESSSMPSSNLPRNHQFAPPPRSQQHSSFVPWNYFPASDASGPMHRGGTEGWPGSMEDHRNNLDKGIEASPPMMAPPGFENITPGYVSGIDALIDE